MTPEHENNETPTVLAAREVYWTIFDMLASPVGAPTGGGEGIMVPEEGNFTSAIAKSNHKAGEIKGQMRQHSYLINLLGMEQICSDEAFAAVKADGSADRAGESGVAFAAVKADSSAENESRNIPTRDIMDPLPQGVPEGFAIPPTGPLRHKRWPISREEIENNNICTSARAAVTEVVLCTDFNCGNDKNIKSQSVTHKNPWLKTA